MSQRNIPTPELKGLLRGRSLTAKLLLITISSGLLAALLLDHLQSLELRKTFREQLYNELSMQAETDRALFDNYVQEVRHASQLIVAHRNFSDYLSRLSPFTDSPVRHSNSPPPWLPPRSLLRAFFHTQYALLLDEQNRVREVYHHYLPNQATSLPEELLRPSPLLRKLSHNQSYMTEIGQTPYIIAAQPFTVNEHTKATLILATPINNRFLADARERRASTTVIALLNLHNSRVIASSDPQKVAEGTTINLLKTHYLMIGKSFFDYGASDLQLQFTSLLSTEQADAMAARLLDKSREQRTLLLFVFVLIASLIMMWVSRRVRELSASVNHASAELLGIFHISGKGGDELDQLTHDFSRFRDEIMAAREHIEKQTWEKLALSRQVAEGKQRAQELRSLQSVTETLNVGIILDSREGLIPFNPLMERFAAECNGIQAFLLDNGCERDERQVRDINGKQRYFEIKRHHALGQRGLLVRDITTQKQAEEERRVFAGFPGSSPNPVLRVSERGEILYANSASLSLLQHFDLTIGDPLPEEWKKALNEVRAAGRKEFEISIGDSIYAFLPAVIDGSNYFYLYGHDITDRKQAEEKLLLSAAVTNNVLDAIIITDYQGKIINVNPAFERITGYSGNEVIGRDPSILRSRIHDEKFFTALWNTLYENGQWEGEVWNRRKDGEVFPCITRISAIRNQHGEILSFVSVFTDISERKEYEEKLTHMAYFDALTHLPNKVLFMDRLNQSLYKAARDRVCLAVLFIDLDGFKAVNDNQGHDMGDLLLQEVAQRLIATVRESDTVSRLSGDEFAVILQEVHNQAAVEHLSAKILATLQQQFDLKGEPAHISGSIGVAIYPEAGDHPEVLLKQADQAMYEAKRLGKNRYYIASSKMGEQTAAFSTSLPPA